MKKPLFKKSVYATIVKREKMLQKRYELNEKLKECSSYIWSEIEELLCGKYAGKQLHFDKYWIRNLTLINDGCYINGIRYNPVIEKIEVSEYHAAQRKVDNRYEPCDIWVEAVWRSKATGIIEMLDNIQNVTMESFNAKKDEVCIPVQI